MIKTQTILTAFIVLLVAVSSQAEQAIERYNPNPNSQNQAPAANATPSSPVAPAQSTAPEAAPAQTTAAPPKFKKFNIDNSAVKKTKKTKKKAQVAKASTTKDTENTEGDDKKVKPKESKVTPSTLDEMRLFLEKRKISKRQVSDNIQLDPQIENATISPTTTGAFKEQAITVYAYYPGSPYIVWCKEGAISDIWLQPGEELAADPLGGDTVRWIVQKSQSGSPDGVITHIAIRPMFPDIDTNIIINTNKHSYYLKVFSTKSTFNPIVRWTYPQEEKMSLFAVREKAIEAKKDIVADEMPTPDKLNFKYEISSNSGVFNSEYVWTPTQVFDDGVKTYIKTTAKTKSNELPVLFVVDRDGKTNLVNYRVNGDFFIIDRLFEQAEMKNGTEEIVTIKKVK
jgi:P-type conjugative transfer protein TrbG